jgi:hypothetical protein
MKKILALIICFATILTSLSFVSCGKTLHYKDGNYYCSQNGVTYKEVSFEYFPVAIGEKYAKLKDTQTGKEIELFEIQGADPEKWLSTENGTLYCAIDEKIPTMNEMKVDRIVLCYEGVVVMALATITDEVDVAYILGRFNNGNVLERPLGNESESVYRLRMTSDDYSWIYYNLSYMEYAEDITECDYPTDMNTYVYRDVDDSVKINEFSEYECWYAVSSKSEESKYIDIAQKSGTHYTTVTKPNGDGTFTDYVRFVFSSAQSTEECVETIVKNYKNGSMTEGALHDALDEPDKSERINIVEYNYGKYFIYDRITGKCVNVDERIFNYREGKVEAEDQPGENV